MLDRHRAYMFRRKWEVRHYVVLLVLYFINTCESIWPGRQSRKDSVDWFFMPNAVLLSRTWDSRTRTRTRTYTVINNPTHMVLYVQYEKQHI